MSFSRHGGGVYVGVWVLFLSLFQKNDLFHYAAAASPPPPRRRPTAHPPLPAPSAAAAARARASAKLRSASLGPAQCERPPPNVGTPPPPTENDENQPARAPHGANVPTPTAGDVVDPVKSAVTSFIHTAPRCSTAAVSASANVNAPAPAQRAPLAAAALAARAPTRDRRRRVAIHGPPENFKATSDRRHWACCLERSDVEGYLVCWRPPSVRAPLYWS